MHPDWYYAPQSYHSTKSSKHSKIRKHSKSKGKGRRYYFLSKGKGSKAKVSKAKGSKAKGSKGQGKGYYQGKGKGKGVRKGRGKGAPLPHAPQSCKFERPEETIEECDQRQSSEQDLPFCVGIRANGPSLWAHFTALARAVETFGPVSGVAGGSLATIVAFIFESIQSNPRVLDCGESGCCNGMEQRARISFLLKSVQAVPSESIITPAVALESILQQIEEQEILPQLLSNDNTAQDAAFQDLLDILTLEETVSLVNPNLIDLLQISPDPVFHAIDILEALR